MQHSDKKPPVWEIKTPGNDEVYVHVLFGFGSARVSIEQDPDMLLVSVEEAKELVGILRSAIDYAEEN